MGEQQVVCVICVFCHGGAASLFLGTVVRNKMEEQIISFGSVQNLVRWRTKCTQFESTRSSLPLQLECFFHFGEKKTKLS